MVVEGLNIITNSRLKSFSRCRMKHHIEYVLGVRAAPSEALRIGTAVHLGGDLIRNGASVDKACDAILATVPGGVGDWAHQIRYEAEKAMQLIRGHHDHWGGHFLDVVKTEFAFDTPLINPATGRASRSFRLGGKIDELGLLDGRLALSDTKTCSEDISQGASYYSRLRLDSQMNLYFYAARYLGYPVKTVLHDVIRKPEIRLLKATPPDKRKHKKDGTLYAAQRVADETIHDYGVRLAEDIAGIPSQKNPNPNGPSWYFQRHEIPLLESDLERGQLERWQQAKDLHAAHRDGHHYRNTSACRIPYRCPFAEPCLNDVDLSKELPEGFVRLNNVHPELQEQNTHACSPATFKAESPAAVEPKTFEPDPCTSSEQRTVPCSEAC